MQIDLPLLRQSERTCFRRCPQRWWWAYREGLTPVNVNQGAAWFGTGIHICLAEWYIPGMKRGRHPRDTWAEYTQGSFEKIRVDADFNDEAEAKYEDARVLGEEMLDMYLEEYGTDPSWEILAPEKRFRVLIPDPSNPKVAIAQNVGTFDVAIRDHETGKILIPDHKTCKAFEYRHLTVDDQAGSYCALSTHDLRQAGLIGPREAVNGMLYNFLRKQRRDTRPRNEQGLALNKPEKKHYAAALSKFYKEHDPKPELTDPAKLMKMTLKDLQFNAEMHDLVVGGEVSKVQPKPIFYRHFVERTKKERNRQIQRIGTEVQVMNMFRSGEIPLYKNPTKDCVWDCDFFELCELDEANGDVEDLKRMAFVVRDPYADHRDGAENSKTSVGADTRRKKV